VTSRAFGNRSGRAAFLCYHSITEGGPPFLSLPPEPFERQLAALRRRGWSSGDRASLDALASGRPREAPRAYLTFDDGYVDNYTNAFPLLREHGWSAFVFVLPDLVDREATFAWPEVAEHAESHPQIMRSLGWPMVEEMAAAGIEFGSHTCSHAHLNRLEDEALRQELHDSRSRLRERLGRCDVLAYPFGEWDPRVAQAAAAAGYRFAFSVRNGRGQPDGVLSIPRVAVDHRDGAARFSLKLSRPGRRLVLSQWKDSLDHARSRRGGSPPVERPTAAPDADRSPAATVSVPTDREVPRR